MERRAKGEEWLDIFCQLVPSLCLSSLTQPNQQFVNCATAKDPASASLVYHVPGTVRYTAGTRS